MFRVANRTGQSFGRGQGGAFLVSPVQRCSHWIDQATDLTATETMARIKKLGRPTLAKAKEKPAACAREARGKSDDGYFR